jgi:hypothetical protein
MFFSSRIILVIGQRYFQLAVAADNDCESDSAEYRPG